jgi:hypothetical protein
MPHIAYQPDRPPAGSALERSTLVFTHAAPYAVIDAGQDGPFQTHALDWTFGADLFGFLKLLQRWTGAADGKEQLGVAATAGRIVIPTHRLFASVVQEFDRVMRR